MCCRRVQTMPPAQPTLVLTTLQMVLLSDAELNQECLAKDFLNCGQYKMGVFFLLFFISSRHIQTLQ